MEDNTVVPTTTVTPVDSPKPKKSHTALYVVVIMLLMFAGAGAYWWRNDQASKRQKTDSDKISLLQKQVDDLKKDLAAEKTTNKASRTAAATDTSAKTETSTKTETVATVPTAAVKENVIASIKTGNTAVLEGYMAASVHVVYAASSGVFDHTPAEAIQDLKYLNSAVAPWDFELSSATLADYETGDYKDYFESNSVVGKSSDGMVVVFNFNAAGKINAVFMSASADLL